MLYSMQTTEKTQNDLYIVRFIARGTGEQGAVVGNVTADQAIEYVNKYSDSRTAVIISKLR